MQEKGRRDTRTRLVESTAELLRRQGYSGTGLKQVAAQAGAPWGSLYHHFPEGKEQLAKAAIDRAATVYGTQMRALFQRVPDPIIAIRLVFDNEVSVLERSEFGDGCPIAGAALDVAVTCDRVRLACSAGFTLWRDIIAEPLVAAGLTEADANGLASFVLATLEGAIVLSRTHRDTAVLRHAAAGVETALAEAISAAKAIAR